MKFVMPDGETEVEVECAEFWIYPRDETGTCAFCHGDPCDEHPEEGEESHITMFWRMNKEHKCGWSSCPFCDGRPTQKEEWKMDKNFKGWDLKLVGKTSERPRIECRRTFSSMGKLHTHAHDQNYNIFGQALMIIALNGWSYSNTSADTEIRLSMNGPCPMSHDDLSDMTAVASYACLILKNLKDD